MREESLIVEPRNRNYKRHHEMYKKPSQQQFADEFNEQYQRYGEQQPQDYYQEPRRRQRRREQQNEFRGQQQREQFRGESRQRQQRQPRQQEQEWQEREQEFNSEGFPFASDQHHFYGEGIRSHDTFELPGYERVQYDYPQSFTETNMRYPLNRKFRKYPEGMQEPVAFYRSGRLPFHAKHPLNEERFFFEEPNRLDGFVRGQYNFRGEQHARYYDERNDYPEHYFEDRARENYNRPTKKKKKRDLRYFRTH